MPDQKHITVTLPPALTAALTTHNRQISSLSFRDAGFRRNQITVYCRDFHRHYSLAYYDPLDIIIFSGSTTAMDYQAHLVLVLDGDKIHTKDVISEGDPVEKIVVTISRQFKEELALGKCVLSDLKWDSAGRVTTFINEIETGNRYRMNPDVVEVFIDGAACEQAAPEMAE